MFLNAQNYIYGVLKQEKNIEIPLANIRLLAEDEKTLINYVTSDIKGNYQIEVKSLGNYCLVVSCIGFKEDRRLIKVTTVNTEVNFELKNSVQELSDVIINAKNQDMYQKNDTISFNLKKLTNGTEVNLKDILKKLPGISIENGKIYAQGKVINKILINGDEFTLNQHILSETLAAKMLGGIDLLKNYKQNSILVDFNTQQEQALNLKIKKEYLGVFKGEFSLGTGQTNKYLGRGSAYNLGDRFKTSIITDANNTGENPISISEFIELKGGLLSLFGNRPSPMSNQISLNNSNVPMSNENVSKVKNEFTSCNINYRFTPKIKISGSILLFNTIFDSWEESTSLYNIENKTINVLDKNITHKTTLMEQGNFSVEYRKGTNENIVYKIAQSYFGSDNNSELNSSNYLWSHFFQESAKKNQNIDQDFSILKRYSNKFLLYSSVHHTYLKKFSQDLWFPEDNTQQMNQQYDFKHNFLSSEVQIVYKPLKIQYELNLGLNYNFSKFNTNLFDSRNLIDSTLYNFNTLKTNNLSVYSNVSINKKTDFFQFLLSLTPSFYYIDSEKNNFLLYNVRTDIYFTRNNHIDFSYRNDYTIIDTQKTFRAIVADSYRNFVNSNLKTNIFTSKKMYNINYYLNKVLTGTNLYLSLSYDEITNAITTNTKSLNNAQYERTNYVISPLQKKYSTHFSIEQRLPHIPFRLKMQGNFHKNYFTSFSQEILNFSETENYFWTLSFQSYFKKSFNINGGFKVENTQNKSYLWNTNNKLVTYKPFLSLEYDKGKGLSVDLATSYNYMGNGSSNMSYFNLSPKVRYRMRESLWEFSMEGNNILNLKTAQIISVDYGNNYFQTSKYSRLEGYLLIKIKRFF